MAVHIWRRRRGSRPGGVPEDTAGQPVTQQTAAQPMGAPPPRTQTVVVDRSRERPRRYRRDNPVSALIWVASWVAALTLLLGIALTWGDANQSSTMVHWVLRAGSWLATPFRDVFTNADAKKQLMENWALAAVVYLAVGRVLAWLTRW